MLGCCAGLAHRGLAAASVMCLLQIRSGSVRRASAAPSSRKLQSAAGFRFNVSCSVRIESVPRTCSRHDNSKPGRLARAAARAVALCAALLAHN